MYHPQITLELVSNSRHSGRLFGTSALTSIKLTNQGRVEKVPSQGSIYTGMGYRCPYWISTRRPGWTSKSRETTRPDTPDSPSFHFLSNYLERGLSATFHIGPWTNTGTTVDTLPSDRLSFSFLSVSLILSGLPHTRGPNQEGLRSRW